MTEAFRRPWLPAADPEAGDVLTGVDMLLANGAADPRRLFSLGHSGGPADISVARRRNRLRRQLRLEHCG